MMFRKIEIDTVPKPHFLLAEQHQKWTVSGALAELVDNAFGQGRGNATDVSIIWDHRSQSLAVLDNGNGMDDIGRLFQLGNTIGRSINDIGIYGSGGTKALLWLGRVVDVWSLRDNIVSHARVVWRDVMKGETLRPIAGTLRSANPRTTPIDLFECGHGTLISIQLLSTRNLKTDIAQRTLAKLYAPALRQGRRLNWISFIHGKRQPPISLSDPFEMAFTKSVKLDLIIEHNTEKLGVTGEIGIIPDLKVNDTRISIGYGCRVITTTRDCFSDETHRYSGRSIAGWLQLADGWQSYLSTTKDSIDDQPLYDKLMAAVFLQIQHLLKETEEDEMHLILDELALNLEASLNFNSDKHIEVLLKHKPEKTEGEESGGGRPGDGPSHDPSPDPGPSGEVNDAGTEKPTDLPAVTQIIIVQETDDAMDGMLCTVLNGDGQIAVAVNKDHPVVQLALQSRPINRMALQLMVTREIAMMLSEENDLYRQVFSRKVTKMLDDMDEVTRQRYMARLLVDRVLDDLPQAAQ
jgi:hypothetical protein